MSFLTIVAREMRVTARRRRTYWVRFAVAALALAIFAWSALFLFTMGAASFAGRMLFGGLTGFTLLYALLGGIFGTSHAISEEKREGTLGLLFLTDLRGHDIVLGKIVAASVNWLFGLLALFPILALSLLMGGVAPGEFWREILGLANLLFYSLALGMLVSALTHDERRSAVFTLGALVALLCTPMLLAGIWREFIAPPPRAFLFFDVLKPTEYSADTTYRRDAPVYWISLGVTHGIAWLFLIVASFVAPRVWQQSAGKALKLPNFFDRLVSKTRRERFRLRALAVNPFFWVAARTGARGWAVMLLLLGILGYCVFSFFRWPNEWRDPWSFVWPAFWMQCVLKVAVAFEACRRFVDDRRSGALELILSTPITHRDIIAGQWRALWRSFGAVFLFVLVMDLCALGLVLEKAFNSPNFAVGVLNQTTMLAFTCLAGILIFVVDFFALAWLSMWRGVKSKHVASATLWTLTQLLVAPWVVFYLGFTGFMMLLFLPAITRGGAGAAGGAMPNWVNDWMPVILLVGWTLVSLVIALWSAASARRNLLAHFRYQATASYQPPRSAKSARIASALFPPPLPPATLPPRLK